MIQLSAPRGLLSRFILILVIPFVLLQIITAQVFYDRHWDTVLRRLASSLAGDIALITDLVKDSPHTQHYADVFELAQARLATGCQFSAPGKFCRTAQSNLK